MPSSRITSLLEGLEFTPSSSAINRTKGDDTRYYVYTYLVRIPTFSFWFSVWWDIPTSAFFTLGRSASAWIDYPTTNRRPSNTTSGKSCTYVPGISRLPRYVYDTRYQVRNMVPDTYLPGISRLPRYVYDTRYVLCTRYVRTWYQPADERSARGRTRLTTVTCISCRSL